MLLILLTLSCFVIIALTASAAYSLGHEEGWDDGFSSGHTLAQRSQLDEHQLLVAEVPSAPIE